MPFTHSDVIYFHSIVEDIFTKTLYFTESYFFEMFNCTGFMASWQVLSFNRDIHFFESRVTTVNISHQNINEIEILNIKLYFT